MLWGLLPGVSGVIKGWGTIVPKSIMSCCPTCWVSPWANWHTSSQKLESIATGHLAKITPATPALTPCPSPKLGEGSWKGCPHLRLFSQVGRGEWEGLWVADYTIVAPAPQGNRGQQKDWGGKRLARGFRDLPTHPAQGISFAGRRLKRSRWAPPE